MRKHLKKIKAQAQSVFGSPSQSAGKVVELQPYTRLKRLCLAVSPKKNKGFLLKWSMSKDFCCSLILRHSQVGSASKSHQVAQQFSLDALQQQLGDPVREQGFLLVEGIVLRKYTCRYQEIWSHMSWIWCMSSLWSPHPFPEEDKIFLQHGETIFFLLNFGIGDIHSESSEHHVMLVRLRWFLSIFPGFPDLFRMPFPFHSPTDHMIKSSPNSLASLHHEWQ